MAVICLCYVSVLFLLSLLFRRNTVWEFEFVFRVFVFFNFDLGIVAVLKSRSARRARPGGRRAVFWAWACNSRFCLRGFPAL